MKSMMAPTELLEKDKVCDRGARRREKSRDAARCRRQQESDTFNEICKEIPVPSKQLAQMDRSTVMRLLISFMKLRDITNSVKFENDGIKQEVCMEMPGDEEYINALNGFIIVLSHDCDILFVSTNVKQYIGIASLDLIGQNLFGYTHEGDHSEITNCLKISSEERKMHSFFMRMKSTLTSSGKNVNLKSATYKVLKCEGVVRQCAEPNNTHMIAYCEPIPHPANIEMVLDCSTFLSQHSLDMKFTFCDAERINKLLGYEDDEMIGKSFYSFCHAEDIKALDDAMRKLFRLGQVTTNQYRLLAKSGGYVWVISQATIINNPRNQQPSYVVCVHYITSGVINGNSIVSLPQFEFSELKVNSVIKQEYEEIENEELGPLDCTEALFCDSTDSIFRDVIDESTGLPLPTDVTGKVFIPCTESLETVAQNAPSIGDEFGYVNFNFEEMFGTDSLRNNAPSIGDPLMNDPVVTSAQQGNDDLFFENSSNVNQVQAPMKDKYPDVRYKGTSLTSGTNVKIRDWHQPSPVSPNAPAPVPVSTSSNNRTPTGDYHVVTLPKSQYKRHIQPEVDLWRDKCNSSNLGSPPSKRQKQQPLFDPNVLNTQWKKPYDLAPSTSGADLLFKGEHIPRNQQSLTSLLLLPGQNCDNPDFAVDPREPSRDRDLSWPLAPVPRSKSLLPVLSLNDCEVNAPVRDTSTTLDWVALSTALSSVV